MPHRLRFRCSCLNGDGKHQSTGDVTTIRSMPASHALERERKLDPPAGFQLPELPGNPLPSRSFTSTYHDTEDRALARAGVTLRRRVEDRKGLWQLKLPQEEGRLELEAPGGPSAPPDELRRLLAGLTRRGPLAPVAVLRTQRGGVRVRENGRSLADVTLDAVAVLDGRRVRDRFVELEVELLDGDAADLERLATALAEAGALPGDGRPKLFRVLGLTGEGAAPLRRKAPADEHVKAAIRTRVEALLAHDPGTRLGADPEDLHDLRVAVRRLRAILRAARDLLEPAWTEALRAELRWLGGILGPVRDLDVLVEHLRVEAQSLDPPERRAVRRFIALLEEEREGARAAMLDAMESERYFGLLDRLEQAPAALPLRPDAGAGLEEIAAREFRRLRKAVAALPREPADDELHAVRIRGKRARYAAELAEPVAGKRATRFLRVAKRFQDVVGEHQDAVVAEERVRALASRLRGQRAALAAGRLVERERQRRLEARQAFPKAWKQLEKSGRRAWS